MNRGHSAHPWGTMTARGVRSVLCVCPVGRDHLRGLVETDTGQWLFDYVQAAP